MDIQQQINFELVKRFGQKSIEFAFPTRTLYVSPGDDASGQRASGQKAVSTLVSAKTSDE